MLENDKSPFWLVAVGLGFVMILAVLVDIFISIYPAISSLNVLIKTSREFSQHSLAIFIAMISGFAGALLSNLTGRDLKYYAENEHFRRSPNEISYDDVGKPLIAIAIINERFQRDNLFVGALMGFVSYLVVETRFIIKILYSGADFTKIEANILGVMLFGCVFGYFSKEILGLSKKAIESQAKKFGTEPEEKRK